jgi:histidinol-phosphate aminotransferase
MFDEACRYPFAPEDALIDAIAQRHGVTTDRVLVGCGSGEVLKVVTEAFVSPSRALVTAAPTFEIPANVARRLGGEVRAIPVDQRLRLDLDAMLDASRGAGLVFVCNPNNPTGTLHGASNVREFVARVVERSPDVTVLIDEAYFDYVDDRSYATAVPLVAEFPQVIVSRTFSKIFGLAGLRVGYAIASPRAVERLETHRVGNGVNVLAAVAARASIPLGDHIDRQRTLNREAREITRRALEASGCPVTASHTNFLMADIGRPVKEFQAACKAQGIAVGRPFPPLETHARISIGTADEMRRAVDVIARVLRST